MVKLTVHCSVIIIFGHIAQLAGILVPLPGIKARPPAVEQQSPNHWTAREFLNLLYIYASDTTEQLRTQCLLQNILQC